MAVEVVIPVFNERAEAVEATLDACLAQTFPVLHIFMVDDGSAVPAEIPEGIVATGRVSLERLPYNQKNAAARNAGAVHRLRELRSPAGARLVGELCAVPFDPSTSRCVLYAHRPAIPQPSPFPLAYAISGD
jgi:glycosyltransferase involved in cell wall biosynthesis